MRDGMVGVSDMSDMSDSPGVSPLPAGKEIADEIAVGRPGGESNRCGMIVTIRALPE